MTPEPSLASKADLTGRTVLVTGAAGGIGLATARALAELGAQVALADLDEHVLFDARDALTGPSVSTHPMDVTDWEQVRRAVNEAAARWGGLHGVAHCAGQNSPDDGRVADVSSETFRRLVEINLVGSFHVAKAAIPHLQAAGGGTIVNVSSAGALPGVKVGGATAYNAGKSGMLGLTRAIASHYAADNIRSVTLCPGPAETAMLTSARAKLGGDLGPSRTLERVAQPDEVAALIAYLLGDLGSFASGCAWALDGNLTGY